MNKRGCFLLVAGLIFIAGCVEEKSEFFINPDGSGKMAYERKFVPMLFDMMAHGLDEEKNDTQTQIKMSVKDILDQSKGVDTWKDVSFELADDGMIHFKGVAYFRDINKLNICGDGLEEFMKPFMAPGKEGTIVIELNQKIGPEEDAVRREDAAIKAQGAEHRTDANDANGLTEEELTQKVREAKFAYNRGKIMMISLLSNLKIERIFHFPGKIVESSNFKKTGDRSVRVSLDGVRLIERLEKEMADDKALRKRIKQGDTLFTDRTPNELFINEILFGERAEMRVVALADSNSLFDYEAEMAKAKANYEKMIKELGLEGIRSSRDYYMDEFLSDETEVDGFENESEVNDVPPKKAPYPRGPTSAEMGSETFEGELEIMSLEIGGVRWITGAEKQKGIRPYSMWENGYSLSLIAELSGPILSCKDAIAATAITDAGDSLAPEYDSRKIHSYIRDGVFIKSENIAVFNVHLLLPADDVEVLKEVSGTFECIAAGVSSEVDLGITEFRVGAEGTEYGAVITEIKKDDRPWPCEIIQLELNIAHESIKSVRFFDETGEELEAIQISGSYHSSRYHSNETKFGFSITGELPTNGQIVLEIYEEVKEYNVPFKLTNISLSGLQLEYQD